MPEPPKPDKIFYWDSCVFLSRFQRTVGRIDTIEKITDAAEKGQVKLLISTYSLSEVARITPSKDSQGKEIVITEEQIEQELQLISGYFENDYIITKPLTQVISEMAREYVAKFGLKPGDAVHVATAIFWDVPVLHTYDDKVLKCDGKIRKDDTCDALTIVEPAWAEPEPKVETRPAHQGQTSLFDALPPDAATETESDDTKTSSDQNQPTALPSAATPLLLTESKKTQPEDGAKPGNGHLGNDGLSSATPVLPNPAPSDNAPAVEEAKADAEGGANTTQSD